MAYDNENYNERFFEKGYNANDFLETINNIFKKNTPLDAQAFLRTIKELAAVTQPVVLKSRLRTYEAADFLGIAPSTLSSWKSRGLYKIPYVMIGGIPQYWTEDLIAFIKKNTVTYL